MADVTHKIPVDRMREWLSYDPLTGEFRWLRDKNSARAGALATSDEPYPRIEFEGVRYLAHRVAYAFEHGEFEGRVDHRNRDTQNASAGNIRIATPRQNQQNRKCTGAIPLKGVSHATGSPYVRADGTVGRAIRKKPYQVKIRVDGKRIHLGNYATPEEAHAAYAKAAAAHFGEFART